MKILHTFSVFLDCASNLKLFLTNYSDFGYGFLKFWCFSNVCDVLVLFCMIFLGFKALQFSGNCKYGKGFSLNCSNGLSRVSGEGDGEEIDEVVTSNSGFLKEECGNLVIDNSEEEELEGFCDEDQVFDEMSLRKMVKDQRRRANAAECELEKERMAASSAADEAMSMILRLQNEKSSLQMELNQLQRIVENKELHDESVIESLEWIIMQHEYEMSLLEEQLKICREKELDQFDSGSPYSCDESKFDKVLISSLESELSPM